MPLVLRQLFASEKFWYVVLLFMAPITAFTAMGIMTVDAWRHDALWAVGVLVGGKSIQGAAASFSGRSAPHERELGSEASPKHKKP
jgi:hypothetical protein